MVNVKERALQDIALAVNFEPSLSEEELYSLLEIDPDIQPLELIIEVLMNVAINPNVIHLALEQRLAAIKAAQDKIGSMFRKSMIMLKTND